VRLTAGSPHTFDGSGADAVITTGTARNVVTVPNSAIRSTAGGTHTVTVMKDGKPTTVRVTLGVAGSDVTQVTSGLRAGQQVVLAELSQPLPGSATSSTNGTFRLPVGGFGGLGGGGSGGKGGR
jgi:multidrug efflux pump subunit AcrA (membrane-fusion protein)